MLRIRHGLCGAAFMILVIMLDPMISSGQPGGYGGGQPGGNGGKGYGGGGGKGGFGGGGKGGGGGRVMDPEKMFAFWAKGGETIDFSRMDANSKKWAQGAFEKMGFPPPDDRTVITKAQFVEAFSKAQAAKAANPAPGGGAPGGYGGGNGQGGYGGAPGGNGQGGYGGGRGGYGQPQGDGRQVAMTTNGSQGNYSMNSDRRNFGPPGGTGERNPGMSGDRGQGNDRGFRVTEPDIEKKFNELDANRDGKLSHDEIPENSRLNGSFKDYDADQDGFIDSSEYKAYFASRAGGNEGDGSFGSYSGNGNYGRRDEKKEELPVAIRFGKLPSGLPSFWASLDSDKDGQVGLYEWRADGRDIKDFQKMDLDGDGLLAPQEWHRYNVINAEQVKAAAAEDGIDVSSNGGSRPSTGGRSGIPGGNTNSKGGSGNRSSEKSSDSKGSAEKSGNRGPWGGGKGKN